ncbi:hypothetical protein H2203_006312 [Taxawa tesnikishii (nom. ined.)]|nr:hypothetical protein H2203_006312 [Dothideales sp. JES 119]
MNTPLAPSVEKAYYRKCIELKRRLNEVEEANDAARLRKLRLNRAIMKMRLERAFLLEQLAKRMDHSGDGSDRDSSPPPTPQAEKPYRPKRQNRQRQLSGAGDPSSSHPQHLISHTYHHRTHQAYPYTRIPPAHPSLSNRTAVPFTPTPPFQATLSHPASLHRAKDVPVALNREHVGTGAHVTSVNEERRVEAGSEMQEARPEQRFSGGFTAVNR